MGRGFGTKKDNHLSLMQPDIIKAISLVELKSPKSFKTLHECVHVFITDRNKKRLYRFARLFLFKSEAKTRWRRSTASKRVQVTQGLVHK